jgi:lipopolysaccharide transport system permease protein
MSKNEAGGTRERGEPSTGRARMSRRRFLALGAGGASVVALGALGASRRGLLSEKNQERLAGNLAWARGAHLTLEERVRERFHYLRLDPEGVRAFARDFEGRNGPVLDLRELWAYRGLFGFLVWRDIKVRYAQTVLGAGWAILQPVLTMVVFTVIFGNFANIPSDGVPYPVFSLAALVPWTYFSTALANSSNSLVSNANLITKVYFPRLVIPLTPVLSGLWTSRSGSLILLARELAFGIVPSGAALLVLPVLVLIMMMTAAGVGCWLAAFHIQYRDVKARVPGSWSRSGCTLSPVVYPMSLVPERYRALYMLNPMAG